MAEINGQWIGESVFRNFPGRLRPSTGQVFAILEDSKMVISSSIRHWQTLWTIGHWTEMAYRNTLHLCCFWRTALGSFKEVRSKDKTLQAFVDMYICE